MIENGVKWARAGLVGGVVASVAGNVANACLTQTSVSIVLRIPMAVIWPVFLFVAVEVLVRNRNARGWLARIGQIGLLSVTVPTAVTSFLNLHALMIKAAEPGTAQLTGPLAIDGLMLGCTIMMLAARVHVDTPDTLDKIGNALDVLAGAEDVDTPAKDEAPVDTSAKDPFEAWEAELDDLDMDPVATQPTEPEDDLAEASPVSAPPALGRSNEVKPESVPPTALELFKAWTAADRDERPRAGEMYVLVGAEHSASPRTARRWYYAVKSTI